MSKTLSQGYAMMTEAISNIVAALICIPLVVVFIVLLSSGQTLLAWVGVGLPIGGIIAERLVLWFGTPFLERSGDW